MSVRSLKLKKGDTFRYIYDFGDDWSHKLKVESVSNPEPEITYPVCLEGARSCPPEDCGGPYGYEDFLNILFDHEDEFFNDFEFADTLAERDYDPESEVNPFLHITLHAVVENQLREKELIEVYQFYNSMRKQKVSHHDTVHLILGMIAPLMFSIFKGYQEFDITLYRSLLKKCKGKRPDKIPDVIDREFESYFGE